MLESARFIHRWKHWLSVSVTCHNKNNVDSINLFNLLYVYIHIHRYSFTILTTVPVRFKLNSRNTKHHIISGQTNALPDLKKKKARLWKPVGDWRISPIQSPQSCRLSMNLNWLEGISEPSKFCVTVAWTEIWGFWGEKQFRLLMSLSHHLQQFLNHQHVWRHDMDAQSTFVALPAQRKCQPLSSDTINTMCNQYFETLFTRLPSSFLEHSNLRKMLFQKWSAQHLANGIKFYFL